MLGAPSTSLAAAPTTVQVKRGETLTQIARRHGTSVAQLVKLNALRSTRIRVGQTLRVRAVPKKARAQAVAPHTALKPKRAVPVQTVTVRRGDTLSALAARHNTSVGQLKRLNHLQSTRIKVGQRLRVAGPAVAARRVRPSVRLVRGKLLGVPVTLVEVDLRDPKVMVTPVLPARGLGNGAQFGTLAGSAGATAMINGGYFHPKSFIPAGDLVVHGRYIATGRVPTAVAITPDNRVSVHPVQSIQFAAWHGFETVIATGPHVLRGGVVAQHFGQGYRDPAVFGRAARSAIGIKDSKTLIFLSSPAHLTPNEVGKLLQRAGARDAILLDGGSSTGLAWQGKVLLRPARQIAYGIGVYANYKGQRYTR